ncbi:MAG TPA: ribbon-helix-helix domain-containing protein [archaeon]|nr:ribbon-helix-helix domain-containing protein [archaeon]
MSTTISFVAEESFSKAIEKIIKKTGLYQSKSEFLRDAAREKLIKMLGLEADLKQVRSAFKSLAKKARYNGELTKEQKDELARKYLKTQKG